VGLLAKPKTRSGQFGEEKEKAICFQGEERGRRGFRSGMRRIGIFLWTSREKRLPSSEVRSRKTEGGPLFTPSSEWGTGAVDRFLEPGGKTNILGRGSLPQGRGSARE